MTQPSGQAGQEVGFSAKGNGEIIPPPPIEPPRTHRKATGDPLKANKPGKDRHKQSYQSPKHVRDVISMVSHDLRTPLTSIHGMLALLSVGACGQLPPEALAAIQVAERGSTRLIQLVNDLLDIERLESGKLPMNLKQGSSKALIQRSLEALIGFAAMHNVHITIPSEDYLLVADEDRLVQVLVNLLCNAIKFSPNESVINICIADKGQDIEFRVTDQGPGIRPANLACLFQRFQQIADITSSKLVGSGLGLAICKAIVEAHKGQIGVESNVGNGSTFWFRVPKSGI